MRHGAKQSTKYASNAVFLLISGQWGNAMPTVLMDTYRRSTGRSSAGTDKLTRHQRVAEVDALRRDIAGRRSTRDFGIDLPCDLSKALDAWLEPRMSV